MAMPKLLNRQPYSASYAEDDSMAPAKGLPMERMHLRRLEGYIPGAQPAETAIKLNTNENPFPPSPTVMAALAEITARSLQRYPDPLSCQFREAAAQLHGVTPNQIIATNGGDELLRLALTTFVDPGRPIGIITPSYGVYSVLAEIHQAVLSAVPLTEDWEISDATAERWNADGAQLALLTNPHAPSGALFSLSDIKRLASVFRGVLLIDEAYIDFVDPSLQQDTIALTIKHPNVLLLRTLSKGYALAGLRLAYGIGSTGLIAPMVEKTKDSYNVDAIAQHLGVTALLDRSYASVSWVHVRQERGRIRHDLGLLGFDVMESQTNFLLASLPTQSRWPNGESLLNELQARNIYVRWFNEDRLTRKLRISIGTQQENDLLLAALRDACSP